MYLLTVLNTLEMERFSSDLIKTGIRLECKLPPESHCISVATPWSLISFIVASSNSAMHLSPTLNGFWLVGSREGTLSPIFWFTFAGRVRFFFDFVFFVIINLRLVFE